MSVKALLCAGIVLSPILDAQSHTQDVVLLAAEDEPRQTSSWSLSSSPTRARESRTALSGTFGELSQKAQPATANQQVAAKESIKTAAIAKTNTRSSAPKQVSQRENKRGEMRQGDFKGILAGALKLAVERSPTLKQASAELGAANADVREAEGQRWPQIDVSANSRSKSFGGRNDSTSQAVAVNMTTTVFDWGRTEKSIDSRKELGTAATQKYLVALETLAQDVSSTVLEKERARRVAAISQQYVERMQQLVGMLGDIVTVDPGRASELVQARARLMEAEASRDTWQARERDFDIKLRKLIGDVPVRMPQDVKWVLPDIELNRLLSLAKNHPALLQAEAEAKASRLHAESLRAAEKPQLNWVVTKSTGHDELGREDPWQTMLTVSWPIFRGGSAQAAREAALLRAEAEVENQERQQMDLEFETRAAVQDAKTFQTRADLYVGLIKETASVKEAFFDQWYHLGRRTLLDVLIAESDYNNNRVNEVSYRFDGYLAVLKAYGGSGMLSRWLLEDTK